MGKRSETGQMFRSNRPQMFLEIGVLKVSQISQENTCVGVSKTQVFSYELCETFKSKCFYRTPPVA